MFNLMALTGRLSRLEQRLGELEAKAKGEGAASGEEEAERIEVKERVDNIRERMKDWETEVSLPSLFLPSLCGKFPSQRCLTEGSSSSSSSSTSRTPSGGTTISDW